VYDGTRDLQNGQLINPGGARGAETENVLALGLAFQERLPEPPFDGLFYWVFGPSFGVLSSASNYANFDFHRDVRTVDDQLADTLTPLTPDLTAPNRRATKLLIYPAWPAPLTPPPRSITYFKGWGRPHGGTGAGFQRVASRRGDDRNPPATQTSPRLFM